MRLDAAGLRDMLMEQARVRMEQQLAKVETSLRRSYRLTEGPPLGADEPLSALLEPDRLAGLPTALAAALNAWAKAVETTSGMRPGATSDPPDETETRALIDRAIIETVDARLAAEAAQDEVEFARRMALLSLFGDAGARMETSERALVLGRHAERLTRRGGMIRDLKGDIASGVVSVSVITKRIPAGNRAAVEAPPGVDVVVLARDQYQGAVSWARMEPGQLSRLDASR
ncbi:hypothetical protein FDP22_14100 [Paroceanicella profunda]|uniref:Uncharacterized protein n=1 Tax=Paroceanicella profunda TaxID=2579971 RepID=A0A5B8FYT2_9RHOB|nr:hypothetical protein FDP22_14100 [Paroceanicella profunda]